MSQNLQADPDTGFYNFIHQVLEAEIQGERRLRWRHPFDRVQTIAPYNGTNFPPESSFIPVQCRDLTQEGFAFLLPFPPDFEQAIVALTLPQGTAHVVAKIIHTTEVLVHESGAVEQVKKTDFPKNDSPFKPITDTTLMFLVGCKFIERIEPDEVEE